MLYGIILERRKPIKRITEKSKNMKRILPFVILLSVLLFLNSCNKENSGPDKLKVENLNIPDGFRFETTRDVDVSVVLPSSVDYSEFRSRVDFYSDDPAGSGYLLQSAAADASGKVSVTLRVPSYLKQVFVQSFAGTALVDLPQSGTKEGGIVIDFDEPVLFDPPNENPGESKSAVVSPANDNSNYVFKSGKATIVNLVSNGDFSLNEFGLISDWSSPMTADEKWHVTSTLGLNHARQHTQGAEKMLRKTSSPARYGGVAQLIPVSPGDLITFSADIRGTGNQNNITWLFLIARNASGNSFSFYSIIHTPTNSWTRKTIAATMPAGTVSVQVLLWSHIFGGTIDFDNVVVTGPVTDSDGDGVDDELDEYPDDPLRAFNVFYPNVNDFGTIAFEDLWPGKGDYDFNDLMVDYRFKQVLNASNRLVEFYTQLSVRAIGASLENGFGFEIANTSPSDILQITGNYIEDNYLNLNPNGTEQGQENAVIFAFDNAFNRLADPGGGFGINTNPQAPYSVPDTFELYVRLANPVNFQASGMAPFNPFIVVNKERGREVHLPGKRATSLANSALFGTDFDDTDPLTGKYYQSNTNLPWAIDIPVNFEYPAEKIQITDAYLRFAAWAESGGSLFPDWYLDNSGYRDDGNIYTKP